MSNGKADGWRKMGIGLGTVTALTFQPPADFRIAVIIGIVAVTGILCQTWLDRNK